MNETLLFIVVAIVITVVGLLWDRRSERRDAARRNQAHPWRNNGRR